MRSILHSLGGDPTVMNGAVMKNFVRPDAPFASALVGSDDFYVSEVDESDGSIALYSPHVAVLNNVSLDHKSLEELRTLFGDFAAKARTTVVNVGDAESAALAMALDRSRTTTFAVEGDADRSGRRASRRSGCRRLLPCPDGRRHASRPGSCRHR